ncbi:centrosomal protein of 72 kDa-like isoform X1 [Acanthaster planci]|uniref:Centrosomal protein of 72 kDa n=1 Tax=Acanthaster planci TaxID=133434 RepID=A0A8B7YQ70_ACAPL|nr:centrosomal protein of 72 kDa-like isoform X1 [Acanthaster planci]
MALTINEKWIRERVHLDPENLDDVRSLALPGTFQEKITHLGSALQNFIRLKHLDLSRNALQSLDGLQHLKLLEKLNVYYNNISTLKDLYQLRHNTCLQEVDLRLNPVTKNEPDYRLFMVHMLPNLRKLDDRSVRESERKAALMHFNSDQATDLTEHLPLKRQMETDRVINPRVEMVANMPRKTTVLDDDDRDVLDLIARSSGDLGRPRDITGSKARVAEVSTQPHAEHLRGDSADERPPSPEEPPSTKFPPSPSPLSTAPVLQVDRPQRADPFNEDETVVRHRNFEERMLGLEVSGGAEATGRHPHAKERVRVQFSDDENDQDSNQDLNAKYADESQAYTAYTSRGHFTPHPDSGHMDHPPAVRSSYRDQLSRHPAESIEDTEDAQPLAREDSRVDLNQFLDDFLSLVDRYWNGTKSLHRHGKFQSQAHSMLATLVNRILGSVPQQRPDIPKDSSADTNKLRQALRAAQDQMANLKDELEAALADKRKLQANLDAVQHETPSSDRPGDRPADSSRQTDRIARSGLLEKEVEKLHLENESLKLHVRHFNQLQELATMLQESHKSLVTTNDHLLQELDEAKQRHLEEVKQLHWSYSELKRTLELAPGMPQGGPRTTNQHHANGVLS